MDTIPDPWRYAVEMQSDFKGLGILQADVQGYFKHVADEHDIEVERPAILMVRFRDEAAARRFHDAFEGTLTPLS